MSAFNESAGQPKRDEGIEGGYLVVAVTAKVRCVFLLVSCRRIDAVLVLFSVIGAVALV